MHILPTNALHLSDPKWLLLAMALCTCGGVCAREMYRRMTLSAASIRRWWRGAAALVFCCTLVFAVLIPLLMHKFSTPLGTEKIFVVTLALFSAAAILVVSLICLVTLVIHHHYHVRPTRELARLRQLADGTFEGIVLCRDDQILDVNLAFCVLLGLSSHTLRECKMTQLVSPAFREAFAAALLTAAFDPIEIELRTGDGSICPVEIHSRPIEYGGKPATILAVRDISERKITQDRIDHLIHHDALTNLANRVLFHDRLQHAMAESDRTGIPMALLYIDLDRFKSVNDLLGHATGDDVLVQVAARMHEATRRVDTVARLGGDEFAVVMPRCQTPQAAAILSARLTSLIQQPIPVGMHPVSIGASIGIAMYPQDASTAEDLLQNADLALYRAKQFRGSSFRFFEPDMDRKLQERRALEIELQEAVQNNQLHLNFQPLFGTKGLDLIGFEALLRWNHPQRGPIPPVEFIPLAEETGLILSIGNWVLLAACKEAVRWPRPYRVAINVSPMQVQHSNLVGIVAHALEETGLPAHQLELEVTESLFLGDLEAVFATLRDLKRLGVSITLDDFGTGYSSLGYLRRFPFDYLKIDRSFVNSLGQDPQADAIVHSIVALSHSLNLSVTAEGVESALQLTALQASGCDQVQGFLLGRPARSDIQTALRDAGVLDLAACLELSEATSTLAPELVVNNAEINPEAAFPPASARPPAYQPSAISAD